MRYFSALIITLCLLFTPMQLRALSNSVVISELQTGTTSSASQEFVELYNPTATDLSIDGWKLQYKSATSVDQVSSWSTRSNLAGSIKAHSYYLIAPTAYLSQADSDLSPGLAGSGGHVRLIDTTGVVIDLLGWGESANTAETQPALAPSAGQSLERLPGRLQASGGNATDTGDNSKDFLIRIEPEPQSSSSALETPSTIQSPPDTETIPSESSTDQESADDQGPAPQSYLPVQISEILINPANPLTDTDDEFVELYNPNPTDVNLEGFVLQTGSNFHDHYTLSGIEIAAESYLALYSSETNLSLTNTGGAARLLDPSGAIVSQTSNYSPAPEGQSWAYIDGTWQWTIQLTPSRANILVPPLVVPSTESATAAKKSAVKATKATAKPKVAKSAQPKVAKTSKAKDAKTETKTLAAGNSEGKASLSSNSAKWLLLTAVALTISYAIYEFRHDLQNFYFLTRRKLKSRA